MTDTQPLEHETRLSIMGRAAPAGAIGPLAELSGRSPAEALADDGYALMRNLHDRDEVEVARRAVLARLAEVGEIAEPSWRGIATGESRRDRMHGDLGAFWRSVSEMAEVRRVIHGPRIRRVMEWIFGESAAHFSFLWLRAMAAGRASPLHIDHPYMNRGSARLLTVWTPLGAVGVDEGPLYMVEGSHRFEDIRARFEGIDVDRDQKPGHFSEHPLDLAASKGVRLLTTAFEPGDCMIFGMFTAHASFDNASPSGRVRLSCDTRWQPAAEPMDERFSGPNPPAHGGKGYGCLAAAQPLTEALAIR